MLKAAKNQNVNFMTIRLSQQLKQELPAWFQVGADHWAINNRSAKCLLNKHKAKTIADLMKVSARIRDNTNPLVHRPTNYCNCPACADDQRKDCTHSHDCATEALARINRTLPKLNPLGPGIRHDNLSLTNRRKNQNRKAREENGKIKAPYSNGLPSSTDTPVTLVTSGKLRSSRSQDSKNGRTWQPIAVWGLRVPGESHSNQIGELAAVIVALQNTPRFYPLEIVSDSKYVIDGLTSHLREWEDRGWIGIQNATLFKKAA
ncbi:hypothetical protein V8E52_010245, partial [Russula decolorans]